MRNLGSARKLVGIQLEFDSIAQRQPRFLFCGSDVVSGSDLRDSPNIVVDVAARDACHGHGRPKI